MFGIFKRKPVSTGPITFAFDMLIERLPADVYALVDWANPQNAKRQLGHSVIGHSPHFRLHMTSMPDLEITLDVIEEKPGDVYAFACDIQPRVGRLETSTERYIFQEAGDGQCRLRLVNEATFIEGMSRRTFAYEMKLMSVATNDALIKLKVLAELGVDAARAVEKTSFGRSRQT